MYKDLYLKLATVFSENNITETSVMKLYSLVYFQETCCTFLKQAFSVEKSTLKRCFSAQINCLNFDFTNLEVECITWIQSRIDATVTNYRFLFYMSWYRVSHF